MISEHLVALLVALVHHRRSYSVSPGNKDESVTVGVPDAAILAMERDRARLIATDRPRPFRIENLGS
jgi:hypothetical protein